MFGERGFEAVRVEEIARAVGITARAVYRHYANKQALLDSVIEESQARYLDALAPGGPEDPRTRLNQHLSRLVTASLDSPHLSVLWQREARHLDPPDLARVREKMLAMVRVLRSDIAALPRAADMPSAEAEIRAWAVLSLVSAPGHYASPLARADQRRLLLSACTAAIRAAASPPLAHPEASAAPTLPAGRLPRREALLQQAAIAFRRSGYLSVSISEIAAQLGIAGPAVYHYFDSKAQLLRDLVARQLEWAQYTAVQARKSADPGHPADVLRALWAGYARVALEAPDLLSVLITESLHLEGPDAGRLARIRADQHAERADWLETARPDLLPAEAATLERFAAALVHDTARIGHLREHVELEGLLVGLASAVCLHPGTKIFPEP